MTIKDENRRLLAASERCGVNMDAVLRGVQVVYYKQRAPGGFLISLEDTGLRRVISRASSRERLRSGSEFFDRVVLAEFSPDVRDGYSLVLAFGGDPELEAFCHEAASWFVVSIDRYESWGSFEEFLAVEDHYNVETCEPTRQMPLDYWCLAGEVSEGPEIHHVTCLSEELGIYVEPDVAEIPLFTSAIFADMRAQDILERQGRCLQPYHLPCLPCYLTGVHEDLPPGQVLGARLNGQWPIDCYHCTQPPKPDHMWVGHLWVPEILDTDFRKF